MDSPDFLYPDELKSSQHRKPPPPPAHNIRQKNNKAIAGHRVALNRVYDEPTTIDTTNIDKTSSKVVKVHFGEFNISFQKLLNFI